MSEGHVSGTGLGNGWLRGSVGLRQVLPKEASPGAPGIQASVGGAALGAPAVPAGASRRPLERPRGAPVVHVAAGEDSASVSLTGQRHL